MLEGWKCWLKWQELAHPGNTEEIETVRTDAGRNVGSERMVGYVTPDAEWCDYCWLDSMRSFQVEFQPQACLRIENSRSDQENKCQTGELVLLD